MTRTRSARRAAVVLPLALSLVVGLFALGAWSEPAETASSPERDTSVVPAASAEASCPQAWLGFNNPVLRYSLCYPTGWGFTDFLAPGPLTSVLTRSLSNLHLLSANAFPWTAGKSSFDAVAGGVTDIELTLLQPGVSFEAECLPARTDSSTFLSCEQSYDSLGLPGEGAIQGLKIVVPLVGVKGSSLLVIVRTPSTQGEVDLAWELVRSIRPY